LLYIQPNPFCMRLKFRGIHALNGGNPVAEITLMSCHNWVFENMGPLWEIIEKEMGCRITCFFVIGKISLPFIAADNIGRFKTRPPYMFHMDILHIPIYG